MHGILPGNTGTVEGTNEAADSGGVPAPGKVAQILKVDADSPTGRWMRRAAAAGTADFPALLAEIEALFPDAGSHDAKEAARRWLLGLWMATDVDAAAAFVGHPEDKDLQLAFGELLCRVAPESVERFLDSPGKDLLGWAGHEQLLLTLADLDPAAYFRMMPGNLDASEARQAAAMQLAKTDPLAAADAWLTRGVGAVQELSSLATIADSWMERDPEGMGRWVKALMEKTGSDVLPDFLMVPVRHIWISALARKDLEAARRELAELNWGPWNSTLTGEGFKSVDARAGIIAAMAGQDLGSALAEWKRMMTENAMPRLQIGGTVPDVPTQVSDAIAGNLIRVLPEDAAHFLPALQKLTAGADHTNPMLGYVEQSILETRIQGWSTGDKLEAARLLATGQPGRVEMLRQIFDSLGPGITPEVMTSLISLPAEARGILGQRFIESKLWDQKSYRDQLVNAIPVDSWSENLGVMLGRKSTVQASVEVMDSLPENAATALARQGFAGEWARNDPEAAAAWLATLPQSAAGTAQAALGLAQKWAGYDETSASGWVDSLPAGPARDGAAAGLASSLMSVDANAAWQWADSVADPGWKVEALTRVARQWGNGAPEEFRAGFATALSRAGVAADAQAQALDLLNKAPGK